MKFVIAQEHRYWWPIKINLPDPEKPGKLKVESFTMEFVATPIDEAKRIRDEFMARSAAERDAHSHDALLAAARDWRDVIDDDKQPVPFSRENLLAMLNAGPWYGSGIYDCWTRSLSPEVAQKGN